MELSIKPEHFTSKFLHINVNNQTQNNLFFPIMYKTPTLTINNLLFNVNVGVLYIIGKNKLFWV